MAIKTPKINSIIRVTEFDMLRTAIKPGNMYLCLDSQKMYYDESANRRVVYNYISVRTVNDLKYNITPSNNCTYYCWEDNSLWLWMNKWISIYTTTSYPSAYVYDTENNITSVYNGDNASYPADNNGLLKDGSVVIRDRQRIIKGKLWINDQNDNLIMASFLGGGIRLLPNGAINTEGELFINDEGRSFIRSEFRTIDNELYVDYTENPEKDPNTYGGSSHLYKVFHEGNLDVSAIKVLTPEDIYSKLKDASLPNPLDLNVTRLNGKTGAEFAKLQHTHVASEILDFSTKAKQAANSEVKDIFSNMIGDGIDISYYSASQQFKMTANNFTISLTGGVSGAALVNRLSDTTIDVTVNPDKHVHKNYVETMTILQKQIDEINAINPDDYYKKNDIDTFISNVTGTALPVYGKPLLVDSNLVLPATSLSAQSLDTRRSFIFDGDITGTLISDLGDEELNIHLSADNIVSSIAEPHKALKLDENNILQAKAANAKKLDHIITINVTGEAVGTTHLDTSLDTLDLNLKLNPGDTLVKAEDIGVKVPSLVNGRVPASQLPDYSTTLVPMGTFNPLNGYPTSTPDEGQFWIAESDGELLNEKYSIGDWCIYLNSQWNHLYTSAGVQTVNNKKGNVTLVADDVNAISKSYIDYTLGDLVPQNYIVRATETGKVRGISVDKLNEEFKVLSDDTGDMIISTTSKNISTDGSTNLDLKFELTDNGYTKIRNNAFYQLFDNGDPLEYNKNINFGKGLNVIASEDNITIEAAESNMNLYYWNGEFNNEFKQFIEDNYANRSTTPLCIIAKVPDSKIKYDMFVIDGTYIDYTANTEIHVIGSNSFNENKIYSDSGKTEDIQYKYMINITFGETDTISVTTASIQAYIHGTSAEYLPITTTKLTPYTPVNEWDPTTKKYVDNLVTNKSYTTTIGNGTDTTYTINHGLESSNIIVQFRDTAGNEVHLSNKIIDDNEIVVESSTVLNENSIKVLVYKLD